MESYVVLCFVFVSPPPALLVDWILVFFHLNCCLFFAWFLTLLRRNCALFFVCGFWCCFRIVCCMDSGVFFIGIVIVFFAWFLMLLRRNSCFFFFTLILLFFFRIVCCMDSGCSFFRRNCCLFVHGV